VHGRFERFELVAPAVCHDAMASKVFVFVAPAGVAARQVSAAVTTAAAIRTRGRAVPSMR